MSAGTSYRGEWDGQDVAVKEIMLEADDASQLREILVPRSLSHPNIANIYGWSRSGHTLVVVMPLFEEGSLQAKLKGVPKGSAPTPGSGGPFGWKTFFKTTLGILHALKYMATRSPNPVVHANLKPANVLLESGTPKLADFGVADEPFTGTRRGAIAYAAYEQWAGEPPSPATDIYSFACIAWELLFAPQTPRGHVTSEIQLIREVESGAPLPMSGVPKKLADALTPCFHKHKEQRPSAAELIAQFDDAKKGLL